MKKFAKITGVGAYLPEHIITNEDLSKMVDTSDDWIMTRIGIKERRKLENGKGASFMGTKAVEDLLKKTNTKPEEIDLLICCTVTPDYIFPASGNIISYNCGLSNAFSFDLNAGCSGFLFGLETGANYIESGNYKKVIVVGSDKMTSITDYSDRTTCPLFGDAAAAILLEYTEEELGIIDADLYTNGIGLKHLHQKAGGSIHPASRKTVNEKQHYIYQEGQTVFKWAVSKMADVSADMMNKHRISPEDLAYLVPHQANMRIIEATAKRMNLDKSKVMINIEKYGNTTSATLPLCLYEWEKKLKKGDKLILSAFGAGFTWGAIYLKWAYDGSKAV